MESEKILIKPLFEQIETYGKVSLELLKLQTIEKSVTVSAQFASRGTIFFFVAMFIFATNIAAALWLGELSGKLYYGFFIVAAFYAIVASILHFFLHDWIKKYFSNALITQILG